MRMINILSRLRSSSSILVITIMLAAVLMTSQTLYAEERNNLDARDRKIELLEKAVNNLMAEIEKLKDEQIKHNARRDEYDKTISSIENDIEELNTAKGSTGDSFTNRFSFGGYGDVHANFTVGSDKDLFDIHRLVLYLGYNFSEWIKFHSELEIEHAFVSNSHDGEFGLEQAYVDFLFNDNFNARAGRVLVPLGIINKKHEPTAFFGVERPSFSKYIIPTTWSADGLGIFGQLSPSIKYEAYVVGGLDGSGFSAKNGIRGGRIKDRPGLNDLSTTGRMDFFPFLNSELGADQQLRFGLSMFHGGLNNGSNGKNPGIDADINIYSGDFEYSYSDLDFSGAIALEKIDGALSIGNGTASDIFGWYLSAGYHFWPDSFKKGNLPRSDAVLFVRYDDYNTQEKMPPGVFENPEGNRSEWTFGLNFYPIPNLVIKADYQIREDKSNKDLDDLFNLGIGWQF